jgi:Flp pilus assembly protein TadG
MVRIISVNEEALRPRQSWRGQDFRRRARALSIRFAGDRSGAMAITIALLMTSFAGIVGLSIDVAEWYGARRAMQSAVDAAAIGGMVAMKNGDTSAQVTEAATTDANLNGIGLASTGTTLTVTVDMTSETVTATMTKTADLLLSGLFLGSSPTISVTAQAGIVTTGSPPCLLVTAPSGTSVTLTGSSSIQASGCAVKVNSTSSTAINLQGATKIVAKSVCGPGGDTIQSGSSVSPTETSCAAESDPLADLTPPSNVNNSCDYNNVSISNSNALSYTKSATAGSLVQNGSGQWVLLPGVYCGGINLSGSGGQSNVLFNPGIYIVRNGLLQTGNSATATGTGVGFWLTGSGSGVSFAGTTSFSITAPTSGAMEGVAIYQDQSETTGTVTEQLSGYSTLTFTGLLYFGNQNVSVSGSSENQSAAYTSMVAYTLTYTGYSTLYLNSNYTGTTVPLPPTYSTSSIGLLQ